MLSFETSFYFRSCSFLARGRILGKGEVLVIVFISLSVTQLSQSHSPIQIAFIFFFHHKVAFILNLSFNNHPQMLHSKQLLGIMTTFDITVQSNLVVCSQILFMCVSQSEAAHRRLSEKRIAFTCLFLTTQISLLLRSQHRPKIYLSFFIIYKTFNLYVSYLFCYIKSEKKVSFKIN